MAMTTPAAAITPTASGRPAGVERARLSCVRLGVHRLGTRIGVWRAPTAEWPPEGSGRRRSKPDNSNREPQRSASHRIGECGACTSCSAPIVGSRFVGSLAAWLFLHQDGMIGASGGGSRFSSPYGPVGTPRNGPSGRSLRSPGRLSRAVLIRRSTRRSSTLLRGFVCHRPLHWQRTGPPGAEAEWPAAISVDRPCDRPPARARDRGQVATAVALGATAALAVLAALATGLRRALAVIGEIAGTVLPAELAGERRLLTIFRESPELPVCRCSAICSFSLSNVRRATRHLMRTESATHGCLHDCGERRKAAAIFIACRSALNGWGGFRRG